MKLGGSARSVVLGFHRYRIYTYFVDLRSIRGEQFASILSRALFSSRFIGGSTALALV